MFFQSKKKRLWRARVPQTATHHANQQEQQPQQLQSQRHSYHHQYQNHHHHHPQSSPSSQKLIGHLEENAMKSSHSCSKLLPHGGQGMTNGQENATSGCCYGGGGEDMNGYDDDQTMSSVASEMSTGTLITTRMVSPRLSSPPNARTAGSNPVATASTLTYSMAATAANVLLNCCGGGSAANVYSNSNTNLNLSNLNNNNSENYLNGKEEKELFRGLISKLKESQLTTLCQAIEKNPSDGTGHQLDCVLVPRGAILGEEPNVIACRLWRWADLKSPAELKSIPSCPSEKDRVYVCCNPTHWSRLCVPDTPPPPYQLFVADRLKPEDRAPSENVVEGIHVQFPESFTTDGEDSSTSSTWCQLAYWELAQRVGGRFPVENSSVNVFSDQPQGDGMCLKTLAEQRQSDTPESVLKARQKIGLGVTLSQEADGVWLYNRSSVPVFVHSPTLNDVYYWFHVSKVPPGYCLRAFDTHRAKSQSLVWPPQIAGAQTGPVDTYSMRISFAKGWGPNYSRQDVTACPCWLEVLLTRR